MIRIQSKRQCCGCTACMQSCPARCIQMVTDPEGFRYPQADEALCLNCGVCEQVCPILTPPHVQATPPDAWGAAASSDALRLKSSSGGVFGVLARHILEKGGVVYGAAFDHRYRLRHIAIEAPEQLCMLMGSKYLQSDIGDCFPQIKAHLQEGRTVLFSGTACQAAGLRKFLGRENPDLIILDVLCHGVPSPEVWSTYLSYRESQAESAAETVSFRSKRNGWRNFSLVLGFANGETYCESMRTDLYMQLFLENIILRPSCHDCRFKDLNRPSDLTIGDFWGVENVLPELSDDKGISLVLAHTPKGRALLEEVGCQLRRIPTDAQTALPPCADSRRSVPMHPGRGSFFRAFAKGAPVSQWASFLKPSLLLRIRGKLLRLLRR